MIDLIERMCSQNRKYDREAFYYVSRAIETAHERINKIEKQHRHISGRELVDEIISLAKKDFGFLASTVFKKWGVSSSEDIGDLVFIMVENGVLSAQESDTREDFRGLYDFKKIFEKDYDQFSLE